MLRVRERSFQSELLCVVDEPSSISAIPRDALAPLIASCRKLLIPHGNFGGSDEFALPPHW